MADKELSELTAAGALAGTEELYLVDASGNSRRVTLSALAAYVTTTESIVPDNLPHRGALVKLANPLEIPNSSGTIVAWETAVYDTDSFWSAGAPTRFTIPAGVTAVRLRANTMWENTGSAGLRSGVFLKSASTTFDGNGRYNINNAAGGEMGENFCSAVLEVTAGDYFEILVFQSTGGPLDLQANSFSWFAIEVVEADVVP